MTNPIPPQVTRVDAPGMNYGVDDRSVLVILSPEQAHVQNALVVEEYIIEQLDFEVVGEFCVVEDARMKPVVGRSYELDESLDIEFEGRAEDGVELVDWSDFIERQTDAARRGDAPSAG